MIYQSRRYILQFKINHPVRSDNHCALLIIKSIYHPCDHRIIYIQVITVELDGKPAALLTA